MNESLGSLDEIINHFTRVPEPDFSKDDIPTTGIIGTYQTWVEWLNDPHTRYWFNKVKREIDDSILNFNHEGREGDRAVGRFQALQQVYYDIPIIISTLKKEENRDAE